MTYQCKHTDPTLLFESPWECPACENEVDTEALMRENNALHRGLLDHEVLVDELRDEIRELKRGE